MSEEEANKTIPPAPEEDNSSCTKEWPNLLDEVRTQLQVSTLMYGLSDLRTLARQGKLRHDDKKNDWELLLTTMPVEATDVLKCVDENTKAIQECLPPETVQLYMAVLQQIHDTTEKKPERAEKLKSTKIVQFDDNDETGDMVHGILVDSHDKEIIVGFRGSVRAKDFMTDAKTRVETIPNAAATLDHELQLSSTIGVHAGFAEYLYGRRKAGSHVKKEESQSICKSILQEVANLLMEHPGYRLYATGHSLGGALATMFAFEAASCADHPNITKPVSCISFASPRVGNIQFQRSFYALEKEGKLRSLRVANQGDVVTLIPGGMESPIDMVLCGNRLYHHVGMKIKLKRNGQMEVSYKGKHEALQRRIVKQGKKVRKNFRICCGSLGKVCCGDEDVVRNHTCMEYQERIKLVSDRLAKMDLNALYRKKGVR